MKCYAAFAKDIDTRMSGSSGGIFPVMSKQHIKNGGIVYASVYDDSFNVVVERIDNESDLERSFTSKYLQSRVNDAFKNIKKDLKDGHEVMFCGTPCQASGLRKYLDASNTSTEKLLILDIICHGVPSEDVFHKFMEKYSNPKYTSLNMRNKETGWNWGRYAWKMSFSDGSETITKQSEIPYMRGFIANLYLRHSCYNCVSKNNSSADITLGDFWGISNVNDKIPAAQGVSCVIARTNKGNDAFLKVADEVESFDVRYEDIKTGNPSLTEASKKPFLRNKFFKNLNDSTDLDNTILRMSNLGLKDKIINKLYLKTPKLGTSTSDLTEKGQHVIFSKKEECCGCSACYSACPVNAIFLKKDREGFFYPIVDTQKCVNCGVCKKVCPFSK